MVQVSLRPNEEWVLIIHEGSQLPLPSEVKWHTDIPGTLLEPNKKYQLAPGDYLVSTVKKNKHQNWGFLHLLYAVSVQDDKLVKIPYGMRHKAIIKHSGRNQDLIPGAGNLAAIVRGIHAVRRGVIDLGLGPKPIYPTRYQRPWVI